MRSCFTQYFSTPALVPKNFLTFTISINSNNLFLQRIFNSQPQSRYNNMSSLLIISNILEIRNGFHIQYP